MQGARIYLFPQIFVCIAIALVALSTSMGRRIWAAALLSLLASASAFTLHAPGARSISLSAVQAESRAPAVEMGRGDKRTAKGKRKAGSHGNSRPKNSELRKRKEAPASD